MAGAGKARRWQGTVEGGLRQTEGVVAKRLDDPYLSRERRWVKVKNRAYWRCELEREGAMRRRPRALLA
jgi:hypothetical protein